MITDIFALFFGKMLGGKKLAPKISPNKTWAGFYGGLISSAIAGYFFYNYFISNYIDINSLYVSIIISLLAQIGDLFESKIKRSFAIKDSGSLIPGHGGFLDRLDGFVFAAPIFVTFIIYNI